MQSAVNKQIAGPGMIASHEPGPTDSPLFEETIGERLRATPAPTTIRGAVADGDDSEPINRLAAIAGRRAPEGAMLLAEAAGQPVAAIGIFDGRAIFDPARASLALRMRLRLLRLGLRAVIAIHGL